MYARGGVSGGLRFPIIIILPSAVGKIEHSLPRRVAISCQNIDSDEKLGCAEFALLSDLVLCEQLTVYQQEIVCLVDWWL